MNADQILDMLGDAKGKYIWEAQQARSGAAGNRRKRLPVRKVWLIAAVIVLMLLLVGCTVVYVLRLQDMKLGERAYSEPAYTNPEGETVPAREGTDTLISLQGVAGSPSYLAAKEWDEFCSHYDTDHAISQSLTNEEMDLGEEYYSYVCYTREMADEIDEICEKYGLQKQGMPQHEQPWENICRILGVEDLIKTADGVSVDRFGGYIYRSGTFLLEGSLTPDKTPADFQLSCVAKTDFDDTLLNIGDIDSYEQWVHVSPDGTELLLAVSPQKALIVADRESYFATVNLLNFAFDDSAVPESWISKEDLEAIADLFDFSFRLQPIDDEDWEYLGSHKIQREESLPVGAYPGAFRDRVIFQLEKPHPEELGYCLMDVDGNGTEELIIARNGVIRRVYGTYGEHTYEPFFNTTFWTDRIVPTDYGVEDGVNEPNSITLCQGNRAICVYMRERETEYMLAGMVDGEMTWVTVLEENPGENAYYSINVEAIGARWERTPITKDQFDQILSDYVPLEIELTPLSEYPLE